jgi:hypothetical protein
MQTNDTNTTETKPWYLSSTILGAITTGLISLLGIFHISIGDLQTQISGALLAIGTAVSTIITIWGRIRATKKISS